MNNWNNAPLFYFEFNDDGVLQFVNGELCKSLGYSREDLIGKPIDKLLPVASRIFYNTHLLPLLTMRGSANEIFMFLQHINGTQIPLLLNGRRDPEPPLNTIAGIVVQNRKQFEEELIHARKELERAISENADLNEARRQLEENSRKLDSTIYNLESQKQDLVHFSKILTHDLQEPLRKLFFYGEMLDNELRLRDYEPLDTWQKIVQAYQRLGSVVSSLQQFVWLSDHVLKKEHIQLEDVVHETQEWLKAAFTRNKIHVDFKKPSRVLADRNLIGRLFRGVIEEMFRLVAPMEEQSFEVESYITKRNVFRGLDDRYQYKDFDVVAIAHSRNAPFALVDTTAEDVKKLSMDAASSLNLAIQRRIMDLHNGFLEVSTSAPNILRISLFFPRYYQEDALDRQQ